MHGFVGEPPTAACGAGPLVTPAGRTFDPDAEGVDICLMCTDNVRRYERWRAQGVPDRRQ